ncbi:MAG: FumA C-terminus/TtdB family hydratase beta subunit [bacterium]
MKAIEDNTEDIRTPLTLRTVKGLSAGDIVHLSGIVYSARDLAHRALVELIKSGSDLPIDITGQVIFYLGPCPPRPGFASNSAGPTTSARMDAFTPPLLERGLRGMIGKGERSKEVVDAMVRFGAVYFSATGGVAALLSKSIVSIEPVALIELGPDAIYKLELDRMPLIVAIDAEGRSLYRDV